MKIRILHIASGKSWRGGEQQVYSTIEYLPQEFESYLICQPDSQLSERVQSLKIEWHSVRMINSLDFVSALKISNFLKKHSPDIIHVHDSRSHTLTLFAHKLIDSSIPIIVTKRTLFNLSASPFQKLKYNSDRIKMVIGISDAITKKLGDLVLDQNKVITIKSGIKLKSPSTEDRKIARSLIQQRFSLDEQVTVVGVVSALTKEKNIEMAIDAFGSFCKADKNSICLVFGEGNQREKLLSHIDRRQMKEKVILAGFHKDIKMILPGFDIFLHTPKSEGLGTSILDAMNARVPVIATEVGGIPEIIQNGSNGFMVNHLDTDSLSAMMIKIHNDQALRDNILNQATQSLTTFDIKIMTRRLGHLYTNLIGS